jgi:hypothetical protein
MELMRINQVCGLKETHFVHSVLVCSYNRVGAALCYNYICLQVEWLGNWTAGWQSDERMSLSLPLSLLFSCRYLLLTLTAC